MAETISETDFKGGGFLLGDQQAEEVFTPEDFTAEHRSIAKTTAEFFDKEVAPHLDTIQHQEPGVAVGILRKSAEIGLLAESQPMPARRKLRSIR